MSENTFPVDWTEWRKEWGEWRTAHAADLQPTSWNFGPKNFLADEILGSWNVNGRPVELSEVTFPDLSVPGSAYSGERNRFVGITFGSSVPETALAASFEELERALGIESGEAR